MKHVKRWTLITAAFLVLVIVNVDAVAPFKKVSIATTPKTATASTTAANAEDVAAEEETAPEAAKEEKSENAASNTKDSKLTGIPQIDYIWDPNLPRELRGYNLSSYPFLSTTPTDDEIHFKCDGLHDGFYASIEYKCQLYHHCVYGIRHDFLCANFTAFDQRTFICHFVSDVDCEGSTNYWNRNDDLYMATTTTSTTTTTTEPPPTQRRRTVRPLRPLRRPSNRRPIDDYYYEDNEYDEDYYEERINRRRKQRPRHRKPVIAEYDDEYVDEKSSFADEKPRRPNARDRVREPEIEPEDDYDTDRRSFEKPKSRVKPAAGVERRKLSSRKPGAFAGRANADERRSFSDDRPLTGRRKPALPADEVIEPVETPRRTTGRRRINEKRSTTPSPASDLDDLDEYEKPQSKIPDQEEAAADEDVPSKVKTSSKIPEEFVTPKAAPSSVYARPRAPPRIPRPVPVNAKNKFQYPVQRTATTSAPPAAAHVEDEDYYEDEEYDDTRVHSRGHSKKRIVDEVADEEEETPAPKRGILGRKPTRTLRKPLTEKKAVAAEEEEDYETEDRYTRRGTSRRRNPLTSRTRSRAPIHDDVDFVDDDYDERPAKRTRPSARKGYKKPRQPDPSEEIDTEEVEPKHVSRGRGGLLVGRRKSIPSIPSRSRSPAAQAVSLVNSDELDVDKAEELDDAPTAASKNSLPNSRTASVRVVKRPFLPSRGGSPYLPRGLQPVGIAHKTHESHTTDISMIDMFSTNSGVHLLEHGAPLLRDSGPRTTLPPRSAIPVSQPRPEPQPSSKATLDELYENDYDVTLNDALNPTLKPLSPHQSNHYHQHHHENNNNNNRPYQSIYSSPSATSSALSTSESFVYKNQSPSSSSTSASSSFAHTPSFQSLSQSQPQLTQSQSQNYHQSPQQQQHHPSQHQYQQNSQNHNNYNSDSYFSSTDIRRRTIISPAAPQTSQSDFHRTNSNVGSRIAPNYYDDYEY